MRDVRGNASIPHKDWHEVEATDNRHAANIVGAMAKHVSIHKIHNMDTPEGKKSYDSSVNRVHDFDANTTPAFSPAERETLFGRVKTALGKSTSKKTRLTFGGSTKRK